MREPISRKQEKECVSCGKHFWSWGRSVDKCLQCMPIPVKLAKLYREQIEHGLARL